VEKIMTLFQIAGAKVKREVTAETAEKMGRLNSKESRLLGPLTNRWEMGLPSGLGLTLGSVGSVAGLVWTLIASMVYFFSRFPIPSCD
jgi:hypothetical protein